MSDAAPDGCILEAPDLNDIRAAAERISSQCVRTPFLEMETATGRNRSRLFAKAETLQRTGAFKLRGAINRIAQLSVCERTRGVIAYSSGNHAQAVALAARLYDTRATIVMPSDAPINKIERTRSYGADVIFYDRQTQVREDFCAKIAHEGNLVLVPPSEDQRALAGAGTVALEIFEQAAELGVTLDAILVPCGGGGLTAATALVAEQLSPTTKIFGVEPVHFDDTERSIKDGQRVANAPGAQTICDAIMTDQPGALTFSINQPRLAGVLTVTDEDVVRAMKTAFNQLKLVVEPGGSVGLAAALQLADQDNAKQVESKREHAKSIAVVLTGGNIDTQRFRTLLGPTE